ncbi:MAG: class I SAM-dependent methyltransferase [Longispora sp.]|nr:class I SAM-dependent methyltransferase [Longispora sp. (in: high G+C Gram-positive bacteria)]
MYCPACAHVVNAAFDPAVRTTEGLFGNSMLGSATYRAHVTGVADRILGKGAPVRTLELGCGEGELLRLLPGRRTGWGRVPTPVESSELSLHAGSWSPHGEEGYDLIVARHVLEHVPDPLKLLRQLRSVCVGRGYFEVPDAGYDLGVAGWDVMYSHASYFHAGSLALMCEKAGFAVTDIGLTFHDQYLYVEVDVRAQKSRGVDSRRHHCVVRSFGERFANLVGHWRRIVESRERPALWGAGTRGVTFLSAVDPGRKLSLVDVNAGKHGRYLPTGHRVDAPERLPMDTDAVIITNPAYRDEVEKSLAELGIAAPVLIA